MALVLPEDRFYSPSPALRALYTLDFLLQSPDYWQSNNNFSNRYSRYYKSKKKEYSIILEIIFFFQIENNAKHSISSFNFGKYIVESKYTNYNYFTMCNSKMCNYRDLYYTCKINLFYYFRFADLYFHFE